jgi:hypothetical protein
LRCVVLTSSVRKSEWRTCWNFPIRESKHLYISTGAVGHPDRPANAKIFTAPPFVGWEIWRFPQNLSGVHLKGVYLIGVRLMGVYLMGVYLTGVLLMGVYLISVHLTGVHFMGVYLMGVQLIGVYLIGVHLIGVHLIDVYFMDVYVSKSKKALGKPSRSPTLQMVVDLLRSEL